MPSSLYNCVKAADVDAVKKAAAAYKKMSDPGVIKDAACRAGQLLQRNMKNLVYGEPSLSSYKDVADSFQTWTDNQNVYVGLPQDHALSSRAEQMDQSYQVNEVATDLAKQSGDIEDKFLAELAAAVS